MLINDFYTCHDIVQHEHEISCRITFNADHDIFKGHFPEQPVVPGVCMMEIVKELLQKQLNEPLMLHNARNVKFLGFITPEMQPTVHISLVAQEAEYMVKASFSAANAVLFKLDGSYGAVVFNP